ncbi:MAG TPA: hypothetical protein PLL38_11320 [Anaerolineales bacterium]|nr:hypothetical protein [Anaerolineales bacterium]
MKTTVIDILRFVLGLVLGLIIISLLSESIEFGLVTLINDGATYDMDAYFSIRNQIWFLIIKIIYNGIGAFIGGWLAKTIASRWKIACVITLAAIQTISFIWGMTLSEFAGTTPTWAWILLAIETSLLIYIGGIFRLKEKG